MASAYMYNHWSKGDSMTDSRKIVHVALTGDAKGEVRFWYDLLHR
jgi:hypothetical protein